MIPDELYQQAGEVLSFCRLSADPAAAKEPAVQAAQIQAIRTLGTWLAPAYGLEGYADLLLVDRLRQLKLRAEVALQKYPAEMDLLQEHLETFRQYLQNNYRISSQETSDRW